MKIMQIYSNSSKFNTVRFNERFNIILGDIQFADDLNKDSHNLGKSTLISLIDYMFLKEIGKEHFLKKPSFDMHVFFMELKLNSGQYLTIKRSVENNTKISFKQHDEPYQNFVNESNWDYFELGMMAKNNEDNAKYILNKYLNFDVLKYESYRKTISYFFRSQSDYSDVFKLKKFRSNDLDWKPILFNLLGFNPKHMIDKYNLDNEKNSKLKLIVQIQNEFHISDKDIDKIKGLIDIKEQEKKRILQWLDKFNFYAQDSKVEQELVSEIEEKISALNAQKYDLDYEINEIDKSLKANLTYNLEEIRQVYEETKIFFSNQLVKEYQELIDFNNKVFAERKQYLLKSLEKKKDILSVIDSELIKLNNDRMKNMNAFTQSNTFEKYNAYRESLITAEKEITKYETEMENADVIKSLRKEISKIDMQIEAAVNMLQEQIDEGNADYKNIRRDFHDFVKQIINQEANLWLSLNGNGNVEFKEAIFNSENEITSQNDGHTYKKIMCACFDLAMIKNYIGSSFYRTVYHDGCLESLDPRKQKQYLDLVRRISSEYDVQYILTALKSDIPSDENGKYLPKSYEIAVTLSDAPDDSGRLFGFSF